MLALVDAAYKFTYIDVGCNGRISDGGVLRNSSLQAALDNGNLELPAEEMLPGTDIDLPYVIVADEAFPMKENIMRPYAARFLNRERTIFNYRLSRARRVVENAFGILANRFRIFLSPICLEPEKVELIVLATCALHNYLRAASTSEVDTEGDTDDPETHEVIPGQWREMPQPQGLVPLKTQGNHSAQIARSVRDKFCKYFTTPSGAVEWQWNIK